MYRNKNFRFFITFLLGFVSVYFGLTFRSHANIASPIWPASGIFIALTSLWGFEQIPFVFLSIFLAKLSVYDSTVDSLCNAFGGSLEAVVGAILLQSWVLKHFNTKESLGLNLGKHILIAFIIGITGSFIGVGSLWLFHDLPIIQSVSLFITWLLGDALGFLFIAPVVILFIKYNPSRFLIFLKFLKLDSILVLSCASIVIFLFNQSSPYVFFIFLAQIYFVNKNKTNSIFFGNFIIYIISIAFVFFEKGPFLSESSDNTLLTLQIYLLMVVSVGLFLYELKLNKLLLNNIRWILASAFIFFGVIYMFLYKSETRKDQHELSQNIDKLEGEIKDRLQVYIDALTSGKSFIASHNQFSYLAWRNYVENLEIVSRYPGINGLGVVKKVPKSELSQFKNFAKNNLAPEFIYKKVPNIEKPPESENHYIIELLEPIKNNKTAIGLDLASEINRKVAADLALQLNEPVITDKITLIQDEKKRTGFLVFVPANFKNNKELSPTQSNFRGDWIYAPFITENFLKSPTSHYEKILQVGIYENDSYSENGIIFDNRTTFKNFKPLVLNKTLEFGKKKWFMKYSTTPNFNSHQLKIAPWAILVSNILIILLGLMLASIQSIAIKAEQRAKDISLKVIYNSQINSLGEMAGGIAHEINNPLAIIHSKLEIIERKLSAICSDHENSIFRDIKTVMITTDRISRITNGLINFSQGRKNDQFIETTIVSIISNSLGFFKEKLQKANIELREAPIPNIKIECQDMHITQVLYNLFSNSIEAVEQLTEKWIAIEYLVSSKYLEIRIVDSGHGISKAITDKIMQPFFTTKPIGKGTGLGLSECRGIIENHKGEFYYDPSHKNTTFIVRLPLKQEKLKTNNVNLSEEASKNNFAEVAIANDSQDDINKSNNTKFNPKKAI